MRYISTRAQAPETSENATSVSFSQAIRAGYAPDGGLYVPATFPFPTCTTSTTDTTSQVKFLLSTEVLQQWSTLAFVPLCTAVMRLWVSEEEIPTADLNKVVARAFEEFTEPEIVKVRHFRGKKKKNVDEHFNDEQQPSEIETSKNVTTATTSVETITNSKVDGGVFVAELFHGPTLAFKDFGQQVCHLFLPFVISQLFSIAYMKSALATVLMIHDGSPSMIPLRIPRVGTVSASGLLCSKGG